MSPASLSLRAQRVVEAILAINDRALERTWIGDGETTLLDMATGEGVTGPHAWYSYLQEWYRGFPDGRVDVVNVVDGGDQVAVEYTGTGTHLGTYYGMTPTGPRARRPSPPPPPLSPSPGLSRPPRAPAPAPRPASYSPALLAEPIPG